MLVLHPQNPPRQRPDLSATCREFIHVDRCSTPAAVSSSGEKSSNNVPSLNTRPSFLI